MKSICISLLAGAVGCALAVPAAATAATKEEVLYSFGKGTDGSEPEASLIIVKDTLYGTTYAGGAHGDGTVFSFDPATGKERILYSFCRQLNCADGENPEAPLIEAKGKLYGTTYNGGADSLGSVFAVELTTGKEKVLHSFGSGTDGVAPTAGLLDVNGTLYGTTFYGGTSGLGTVFSLDPTTGAETVLYSFLGGTDGEYVQAGLIEANGVLVGTTVHGGANNQGTVFSLNSSTGGEFVLYSFCSQSACADGGNPTAAPIYVNSTLYGTTSDGATSNAGAVFSLNPSTGVENVLHAFGSGTDGAYPQAGVIDVKGTLYSTTDEGGANCTTNGGCGTVFALNLGTGTEKVVHSFGNGTDGSVPEAGLVDVSGLLYGTTYSGGAYGYGTLFVLTKR